MADASKSDTATGPTAWERFVSLARKVTQTPKAEVDKRAKEWREERQAAKPHHRT